MDKRLMMGGAFILGVIVGAAGLWLWYYTQSPDTVSAENESQNLTPTTTTSVPPSVISTEDSIAVKDQPAATTVIVTATLSAPSWIVIHDDRDGLLGNALGAGWLPAGTQTRGVTLLRATEGSKTYHAVIYRDNGNKTFELKADTPLKTPQGQLIQEVFETFSGSAH